MTVDEKDGNFVDFFDFYYGKDKEQIYLPVDFNSDDLKVYYNEGSVHDPSEPVLISFTMKRKTEIRPEQDTRTGAYFWECQKIRIDSIQ